jgi:hypothetical protein
LERRNACPKEPPIKPTPTIATGIFINDGSGACR